jgi:alkylation response protein AidB-like acyl-CoA dehydrogenase
MIDFELDEELSLIRETAAAFAGDHLRPRDREFEAARAVAPEVREAFHEIGLDALELPEALGGAGLGALARSLVVEELAAADAGAALALDPLGPALYPILELGGEKATEALLRPLLDQPGARAVLAWDPAQTVRVDGELASGAIPWVPADRIDLLALLRPDGAAVIVGGITREELRGAGLRAAGASSLRLESAPVRAAWENREGARRALARARLYLAAMLIGVMRAAADLSREYAVERVAFGRPIAHHQALAFLIADMASAVDGSRLLLWDAAWRIDHGDDGAEACAAAFTEAAEQAMFVTPSAVQILGGHGFMQDYPVEKFMREARALGLALGGIDAAREDAGRELAGEGDRVPLCSGEA